MSTRGTAIALLLAVPALTEARTLFRPFEPFHLTPIAPDTGVLVEIRPTLLEPPTSFEERPAPRLLAFGGHVGA